MGGVEGVLRWALAVAAGVVLVVLVVGLVNSHRRPRGRASGAADRMLRPGIEALTGIGFFGAGMLLWRPIPWDPQGLARVALDVVGALLMVGGLGLVTWGKAALGPYYGVSSAVGAQLHADHRLVVDGPFAFVRHPMYVGIEVAAIGALLVYRTWTTVFLAVVFLGLAFRARQ